MKEHRDPYSGVVYGRRKDHLFEEKEFFGLSFLSFALSSLSVPLLLVRRGGGVGISEFSSIIPCLTVLASPEPEGVL